MVTIKNAAVPPSCYFCPMTNDGFYLCKANNPYKILEDDCEERRPDWCPLVPVPPHGRLIDADALYKTIDATSERTIGHTTFKETVLLDIRGMPTILESTMGQVNSEKAINEAEEGE